MNNIKLVDLLKDLIILTFLAIPPFIAFRRRILKRANKLVSFIIFIIYMALTIFTQNLAPFILVMLILHWHNKRQSDYRDNLTKPIGSKKFEIVLYSITFKFIILLVTALFVILLMKFGINPESQDVVKMFYEGSWGRVIWLSLITVLFAPFLEEYVFRHIFYRGFSKKIGKTLSAVLTSVLFMILHFNIASSIGTFSLGIMNCILYEKYGYRAAVLNHFIFNLTSTIVIIALKIVNPVLMQ
ncbi:CPBP family intramembrane glutamic endopeptidase [Thermobrachium celere]|uniref:Putative protease n=1 Tax=Thermobrachium celere DSM 8682 TaxID=941824 RepID=R7RV11_9CLOT|nr:CPBP family intramembrane glutamic endopeptidase [Thermobrachium celere]CDF59441.1 putative protease [Thermobrachium celere DSM 8682]